MDSKGKNESWSHAFLIARHLLLTHDYTISRAEIEALITGSNTLWLLGQILSNWMHIFILAGDAQISLYWVLPDKLKFELWHRTRNRQQQLATDVFTDNIVAIEMSLKQEDR